MNTYFKLNDITLDITEEDLEVFKHGKPDFIGFNCYGNETVEYMEYEKMDFSDMAGADNRKLSYLQKLTAKPGIGRGLAMKDLKRVSMDICLTLTVLGITARKLTDRYHLPLIITENGYGRPDTLEEDGTIHDDYRIEHLRRMIQEMKIGIEEGANLFGYCPWSALDLVSTREGITKRYGFIYVDRDEDDEKAKTAEMKRYRKDSFYWYEKLLKVMERI
ncbi:MAG: family 1 glycosylhydrolase [Holdemanella porci]